MKNLPMVMFIPLALSCIPHAYAQRSTSDLPPLSEPAARSSQDQTQIGEHIILDIPSLFHKAELRDGSYVPVGLSLGHEYKGKGAVIIAVIQQDGFNADEVALIIRIEDGTVAMVTGTPKQLNDVLGLKIDMDLRAKHEAEARVEQGLRDKYDAIRLRDQQEAERQKTEAIERKKAELQALKGRSVYFVAPDDKTFLNSDVPYLTRMVILSAESVDEDTASLELTDSRGKHFTYTLSYLCKDDYALPNLRPCGVLSSLPAGITPREMAAIRNRTYFIGMRERALTMSRGLPERTNEDASSKQLVYGQGDYVYIRHGVVENYQISY